MKLWPYHAFVIETSLSGAEVAERLRSRTVAARLFGRQGQQGDFTGRVTDHGFQIRPRLYSGASFAPDLHGRIRAAESGATVEVQMTPAVSVLLILTLLFGALNLLVLQHGPPLFWLLAASVVLGWLFAWSGLWFDGGRSRRKLVALLASNPPIDAAANSSRAAT